MEETLRIVAVKEVVVYVISLSLMMAGLALFLQECYQKDMILRRYYVWLNYLYIKNRRSNKWQKRKKAKNAKRWFLRNLTKPMGLCVYCNASWLTIGFVLWGYWLNIAPQTNLFYILILCIGMTYLFVVWLKKLLSI